MYKLYVCDMQCVCGSNGKKNESNRQLTGRQNEQTNERDQTCKRKKNNNNK